MSFVERRLKPLPPTFAYETGDETATLRRSRRPDDQPRKKGGSRVREGSWTFSEHLPDEAPERPNSSSTDEEGEPPVAWPDTDDEDSSFQSYWKNCDSTVCSTLQGSPTCSEPDIDAPLVNDTPVAASLSSQVLRIPLTCCQATPDIFFATKPQYSPMSCASPTLQASPMSPFMGASPSFKLDTYTASPVSPDASPVGAPVARTGSDGAVTTLMLRRLG
ncbi:unnamed protein product [Durusdinium trenchii]|uniref:Uncharacterized protein n=1 Tax=Durusdinium trenchii TaxID=1381693 RepID=A0ABP0IHD4_9DINO